MSAIFKSLHGTKVKRVRISIQAVTFFDRGDAKT